MVQKLKLITSFFPFTTRPATIFYDYLHQLYKAIDNFTDNFKISFILLNFGLPGRSTSNPM